jgi:phage/conjugal plasmid C-4 type zinc finger TraR family protein
MAVGWSKDGEVQEQIDSTVEEALDRVRAETPCGESLETCEVCTEDIPAARRKAIPGVRLCVRCQTAREEGLLS